MHLGAPGRRQTSGQAPVTRYVRRTPRTSPQPPLHERRASRRSHMISSWPSFWSSVLRVGHRRPHPPAYRRTGNSPGTRPYPLRLGASTTGPQTVRLSAEPVTPAAPDRSVPPGSRGTRRRTTGASGSKVNVTRVQPFRWPWSPAPSRRRGPGPTAGCHQPRNQVRRRSRPRRTPLRRRRAAPPPTQPSGPGAHGRLLTGHGPEGAREAGQAATVRTRSSVPESRPSLTSK